MSVVVSSGSPPCGSVCLTQSVSAFPSSDMSDVGGGALRNWRSEECRTLYATQAAPQRTHWQEEARLFVTSGEAAGVTARLEHKRVKVRRPLTYEDAAVPERARHGTPLCAYKHDFRAPEAAPWRNQTTYGATCLTDGPFSVHDFRRHGCGAPSAAAERHTLGPWATHCLPLYVRTPVRAVKVLAATVRHGRDVLMPAIWKSGSTMLAKLLSDKQHFRAATGPHAKITGTACQQPASFGSSCPHTSVSAAVGSQTVRAALVRHPLARFVAGGKIAGEHGKWQARALGRSRVERA